MVLIVVLGVLVVLTLLATTFASLQGIERDVSRNYLDGVRARLAAKAGVEDALQRMHQVLSQGPNAASNRIWRYYGNDVAEVGDAALINVPLEEARNPSFAWELESPQNPADGNVTPRLIAVNGKKVGFSSVHESGTYGAHSDFYSLHIRDLQGLIHVNDGLALGPNGSVSQNLRRILNNLGAVTGVGGLGDILMDNRPPTGYQMIQQLEPILGATDFKKVRNFLTTKAWVDPDVANPVPFGPTVLTEYPVDYYRGGGIYRYGRSKNSYGQQVTMPLGFTPPSVNGMVNAVYGLDELNPQWIEIVERAPVNVNSAPKEVLVALLDGLRGVFMVERRRNNVPGWQSAYQWLPNMHTYDQMGGGGDEVGFLYQTVPIVGPGTGTVTSGVSAEMVAEHMIACREKKMTPGGVLPAFNYSTAWFGGSFRTWKQFNAFCDNLVKIGLFQDNRPIFFDVATNGAFYPSQIQRNFAAQAIADTLKANFNPNLHLNELNPDANLFTHVDKTDLIVNSTEFCFLPSGYFGIESLGRVVIPVNTNDAWTAADNIVVSEQKLSVVVKLFHMYRETSQKHFYKGTLAPRLAPPLTNNNLSLEIGPEVDQGDVPSENEWDGYISLATVGGHGVTKAPKTLMSTPGGPAELGSVMHGHYTYDFQLHNHMDGYRQDLATVNLPGEGVENLPDRTESIPGPYAPTAGGGNVYRLARSFRLKPFETPMPLSYKAPLDLRVDGAYSERHAASAYWLSTNLFYDRMGDAQGVLAAWIKPSYFPEMSGKPRMYLSADRLHGGMTTYINPSPFMLFFTASHDNPAYMASSTEGATPAYNSSPFGVAPFKPMSLGFGYGYSSATGYGSEPGGGGTIAEGGFLSPSLNHLSHPDASTKKSPLQGHKWIHVVGTWRTADKYACTLYINGQLLPQSYRVWYWTYRSNSGKDWTLHEDGSRNSFRIGAVSRYRPISTWGYARNWPADATIDELYLWKNLGATNTAFSLWQQGRYYKPDDPYEGYFTSAEINLTAGVRSLAPPSIIAPPAASGSGAPSGGIGTTTAAAGPSVKLLGVAWTWFGESVDKDGDDVIEDHVTGGEVHPEIQISILSGGAEYGPFGDDGYTPITAPSGAEITLSGPFQYKVQFSIPDAQFDSILLASPVFDDITFYYSKSDSIYESYHVE